MLIGGNLVGDVDQIRGDDIGTWKHDLIDRRRCARDRAHDVNVAVVELKRVEIADDYDSFVWIRGLAIAYQAGEKLSLRATLCSHARSVRRVVDSRQRTQVIDNDRHWKSKSTRRLKAHPEHQRWYVVESFRVAVGRIDVLCGLALLRDAMQRDA